MDIIELMSMAESDLSDYAQALATVCDWWRVSGAARMEPESFAPFENEWVRVKSVLETRDIHPEWLA